MPQDVATSRRQSSHFWLNPTRRTPEQLWQIAATQIRLCLHFFFFTIPFDFSFRRPEIIPYFTAVRALKGNSGSERRNLERVSKIYCFCFEGMALVFMGNVTFNFLEESYGCVSIKWTMG